MAGGRSVACPRRVPARRARLDVEQPQNEHAPRHPAPPGRSAPAQGVLSVLAALLLALTTVAGDTITVSPRGDVRTVGAAVRIARPGAVIRVEPGTYAEPMIVVDKRLTLIGDGLPVL